MSRMFQYYGRLNGVRGSVLGLPSWARLLVLMAAVPGLVLLALSALVFIVSLFALLLLAAPTYRLLRTLVGASSSEGSGETTVDQAMSPADLLGGVFSPSADTRGARHVDARVVEGLPGGTGGGAEALGPR